MNLVRAFACAAIFAGLIGASGCELLSSVDRSKIGGGAGGGGTGGGGTSGNGGGGTGGSTGGSGGMGWTPPDDMNEWTDDVCNADGTTAHNPKAAGEMCAKGGSQCDGNGNCVECIIVADCPGMDNACQTRTCSKGVCGFDFQPAGTQLPVQTTGDCKLAV